MICCGPQTSRKISSIIHSHLYSQVGYLGIIGDVPFAAKLCITIGRVFERGETIGANTIFTS